MNESGEEVLKAPAIEEAIRELGEDGIDSEKDNARASNDSEDDPCGPHHSAERRPLDFPNLLRHTSPPPNPILRHRHSSSSSS
ncbi:hypothetical protein Sjap_023100 [Stephania japonica]|uniref:Uncharacterized protein n=1 Tax=Stephania japonica TaxID=461633 RepID=A0AAP0HQH7_9MAGN